MGVKILLAVCGSVAGVLYEARLDSQRAADQARGGLRLTASASSIRGIRRGRSRAS